MKNAARAYTDSGDAAQIIGRYTILYTIPNTLLPTHDLSVRTCEYLNPIMTPPKIALGSCWSQTREEES